jgi:hypothetical protein
MSTLRPLPCVLAALLASASAWGIDVRASEPTDLSVTVYRAPSRAGGSLNLDGLGGFALISETRSVTLQAGEARLLFEGVADGIEAASAILTGLPMGVLEKNRDANLLSPSTLIAAAVGDAVDLIRTNPKTGKAERVPGTIRSDAEGGVVFESAEGLEGLRCAGLPETFSFTAARGLAAKPTLSVRVRAEEPITATVTLSYLARGFDWSADYVANLAPGGKTMDLTAWVTLANGNGAGFPAARTQVVAGRLNRESQRVEPIAMGSSILAHCWPRGSTSDSSAPARINPARPLLSPVYELARRRYEMAIPPMYAAAPMLAIAAAVPVQEEQLGDLKLYRVPERTTVASRQSKQVRLLDRPSVPVQVMYRVDVVADLDATSAAAPMWLRTSNDAAHRLDIPLPSGRVAVFTSDGVATILLRESNLRDVATGEEFEVPLGRSPDVRVSAVVDRTFVAPGSELPKLPVVPGVADIESTAVTNVNRVEITNAHATAVDVELRISLPDGARVIRADRPLAMKDGRPMFRVAVPAHGTTTLRYQVQRNVSRVVPG